MTEKDPPVKYGDPGHPTVTVQVGKTFVSKVLVDLGAAINIMTLETTQLLQLKHLIRETPTILELADRSTIKPEGVIEDLVTSVESWNYPADFVVLQTKTKLGGHPLILGRPWLATADAFISCRSGSMTISNGQETKQSTLYSHATPMINNDNSIWVDYEDEETQPILTIRQALTLKNSTEDELISNFIYEPSSVSSEIHNHLTTILESESQNNLETENSSQILVGSPSKSVTIEIEPGKTLNINPNLTDDQKQQLMKLLKENKEAFAWDYKDMKGISPELCTHRIYIKEGSRPVCQPQRRMNPNLREIVKEELQKLLNAGFIYPISDSEWVSPLVIVPKKNGKWRNLEKVLKRCIEAHLALSTEKCHMMMNEGIVLGHYVSLLGIHVDPAKIQVILTLPIPKTQTEVRSFLGHAGYYRRFIKDFSKIASPLFVLLTKNAEFKWSDDCEKAFDQLKHQLSIAPILRGPDWACPFHISFDASDTTIGAVLGQEENGLPYAIYFISKNMTPAELNYTVTEKEFLAVIYAINKFRHYITSYTTFVHTDHSAIKYLMNKSVTNARVTRWLLLLQEFDITILDRPRKENVVVDFLSRLKTNENIPVDDSFPDEYLFAVSAHSPWYADIANYLVVGKLPSHLSHR
eukprot:PITA_28310